MRVPSHRWNWVCAGLAALVIGGGIPRARAGEPTSRPLDEFRLLPDVPYFGAGDPDPAHHTLDVYLPKQRKDFPVLFLIHGGAWRHGDKRYFGAYSTLGIFWARHGVAAVIPNYRLSPAVSHPAHIQDVARAFAWTYRHIGAYGGCADEIFVGGHSAGGHLAALLATDERYLKAEGLRRSAIRGVIPMSGVYDLTDSNRLFESTFGTKAKAREDAAPLCHVCPQAPPFFIIYADHDLALCGKEPAERFCQALRSQGVAAETLEVKHRNHVTLLLNAVVERDPVSQAMRAFISAHLRQKL